MNSCSGVACWRTGFNMSYGTPPVYSKARDKKNTSHKILTKNQQNYVNYLDMVSYIKGGIHAKGI